MAQIHTVKQGEHISGIAYSYGFRNYLTLWNNPSNATLKQLRQNPNVLYPGDQVVIPDRVLSEFQRPTDKRHSFVLKKAPLELCLILGRIYGKPMANVPCVLSADSSKWSLISDSEGKVKHEIPQDAIEVLLLIQDKLTVKGKPISFDTQLSIKVGYLDPVEEQSGQAARLANLGYYRGSLSQIDSGEFESAVEEFQCEANLKPVDGICGPATQAKLKQLHGC